MLFIQVELFFESLSIFDEIRSDVQFGHPVFSPCYPAIVNREVDLFKKNPTAFKKRKMIL